MSALVSFFLVLSLVVVALVGAGALNLEMLFGVVIPYLAIIVFIGGVIFRVLKWSRSPVPFRIPTTSGQQKSLPWIKASKLESPPNNFWVVLRMALEIFAFRSLLRNTKSELSENRNVIYWGDKWLWAAGLAFHWSFLVIFLRHFRFFMEPVPVLVPMLQTLDGFFEMGVPTLFISDLVLLAAVSYLFARRVVIPQIRYISFAADYFPLLLIIGIGATGVLMRHFLRVDLESVKALIMGVLNLHPVLPASPIGVIFYIHLFLVCTLLVYFPLSKLMHMPGVFMSPTRNLANNNRSRRHVNPWNYPVKTHGYDEWEDEFRELMKEAGLPVEKE